MYFSVLKISVLSAGGGGCTRYTRLKAGGRGGCCRAEGRQQVHQEEIVHTTKLISQPQYLTIYSLYIFVYIDNLKKKLNKYSIYLNCYMP